MTANIIFSALAFLAGCLIGWLLAKYIVIPIIDIFRKTRRQ